MRNDLPATNWCCCRSIQEPGYTMPGKIKKKGEKMVISIQIGNMKYLQYN